MDVNRGARSVCSSRWHGNCVRRDEPGLAKSCCQDVSGFRLRKKSSLGKESKESFLSLARFHSAGIHGLPCGVTPSLADLGKTFFPSKVWETVWESLCWILLHHWCSSSSTSQTEHCNRIAVYETVLCFHLLAGLEKSVDDPNWNCWFGCWGLG